MASTSTSLKCDMNIPREVYEDFLGRIQAAVAELSCSSRTHNNPILHSASGWKEVQRRACAHSSDVDTNAQNSDGDVNPSSSSTSSEWNSSSDDEIEPAEESDSFERDKPWPLAKWKHEVTMPKSLTAKSQGLPEFAATEKAMSAKLLRAPLQDAKKAAKQARGTQIDTAGSGWFDMKAQPVTDEVKRDWRLLRLRAAYDPKHFYKSFDSTKIPKYFQRGTVIEGAGEFYSARMTKKERKQTLTEELLADVKLKEQRKRRYETLQQERMELAKKRKKIRALHQRSRHRPKH